MDKLDELATMYPVRIRAATAHDAMGVAEVCGYSVPSLGLEYLPGKWVLMIHVEPPDQWWLADSPMAFWKGALVIGCTIGCVACATPYRTLGGLRKYMETRHSVLEDSKPMVRIIW
jgi:hypothetical protein